MKDSRIGVVGMWHLGCVTAACLTEIFDVVIGFDTEKAKINNLNNGKAPLYEPGLNELIKSGIESEKLMFSCNVNDLSEADYIWIAIDTPINEKDECNLNSIFDIIEKIGRVNKSGKYIVSSQVPVGTCEMLLEKIPSDKNPKIAYLPENLQLGKAIEKFKSPDMIVIGSDDILYANEISDLLSTFSENRIICDIRTAEFSKHAINSFLAASISFSNQLSDLAVAFNANTYKIVEIMRSDQRIGKKLPLFPGPWFSGGTLARDIRSLQVIGEKINKSTKLFDEVININENRINNLIGRIENEISLENTCIGLLGLVYTEGTDTLRRSPGLQIINYLKKYNTQIRAFEPMINKEFIEEDSFLLCDSAIEAARNTDVIIVLRAGSVKNIDLSSLLSVMKGNIILDIWASFSKKSIEETNSICIKPGC